MTANVETMAYAGQTPWHGIGTQVSSELTPQEMIQVAKLNWNVRKVPVQFSDKRGNLKESEDWFVLIRDDNDFELGPCGKKYVPFQNNEIFDFYTKFVNEGHMTMETMGSLSGFCPFTSMLFSMLHPTQPSYGQMNIQWEYFLMIQSLI